MDDFPTRKEGFMNDYGELTRKYKVDFGNRPVYVPTDHGTFETLLETQLVDLEGHSVISPIQL